MPGKTNFKVGGDGRSTNFSAGRTTARVDAIRIVFGEINVVVSHMRRNARWASLHGQGDEDPLLVAFKKLKQELNSAKSIGALSVESITQPFLEVVRNETTSGPITGVALSSIHKFLAYGIFAPCKSKAEGVAKIGEAVTHTRFVFTDVDSDEVVLMKLLQVLRTLTVLPISNLLTDEAVCEMIQAVFRISCRSRLSKLLRKTAEQSLFEMVVYLFGRLPEFLHLGVSARSTERNGSSDQILPIGEGAKKRDMTHKRIGSGLGNVGDDGLDVHAPAQASIRRKSSDLPSGGIDVQTPTPTQTPAQTTPLTFTSTTSDTTITNLMSTSEEELGIRTPAPTVHLGKSPPPSAPQSPVTRSLSAAVDTSLSTGEVAAECDSGNDTKIRAKASKKDSHGNIVLIETVDGVVLQSGTEDTDLSPNANQHQRVLGEPYSLPCLTELFRFLTTLIDPRDPENTDGMMRLGVQLLTVAVEVAGPLFPEFPSLLALLSHEMCRYMCAVASTGSLTLFTLAARLGQLTFQTLRPKLKFQLECFLNMLMKRVDDQRYSPEHTEAALDVILHLCRDPEFVVELYLNYDSSLFCSNLLEKLVKFLSEHTFPTSGQLLSTHSLALDVLMEIVSPLDTRIRHVPLISTKTSESTPAQSSLHRNSSLSALEDLSFTNNVGVKKDGESLLEMAQSMKHSRSWNSLGARDEIDHLDDFLNAASLRRLRHNKKLLSDSAQLFNNKPKAGIAFLHEHGIIPLENYERDLVVYLRTTQLLDKTMIGEFIGRPEQTKLLAQYTKEMNMEGKRIDESLRDFLEGFRLPGEAQIIFRIMEAFAEQYLKSNPGTSADVDSSFVLSYAIIMLNVDQHNPRVKKKMSLDDFRKNQRGLNGGKDFDPRYLEDIYESIKSNEIIMPDEQDGPAFENYKWAQILSRTEEPMFGTYVLAGGRCEYDKDVFMIIWKPVIAAVKYIFDTATTDALVQRAIAGFQKSATLAAAYGLSEAVDKMVITLTNFTSLLATDETRARNGANKNSITGNNTFDEKDDLPIRFGKNYKAQLAAVTVFSLAREQGEMLREGWTNVLECVQRLYLAKLLPTDMTMGKDFIEASGTVSLMFSPKAKEENKDNGILSALSAYLLYSEPVEEIVNPSDVEAKEATLECIRLCKLQLLFQDSGRMSCESLRYLTQALVHESRSPYQRSAIKETTASAVESVSSGVFHEGAACLFLEEAVRLCLRNQRRVEQIWPMVVEHMHSIILTPGQDMTPNIITRAIIGLLQLATACYRSTHVANDVLPALSVLLRVSPQLFKNNALQICGGLAYFLNVNGQYIKQIRDWDTVLSLVATCAHARTTQIPTNGTKKSTERESECTSTLDAQSLQQESSTLPVVSIPLFDTPSMALNIVRNVIENHLTESNFMPCLRCLHKCIVAGYPNDVHPKYQQTSQTTTQTDTHNTSVHTPAYSKTPTALSYGIDLSQFAAYEKGANSDNKRDMWSSNDIGEIMHERNRLQRNTSRRRGVGAGDVQGERTAVLIGLLFTMSTRVTELVDSANSSTEVKIAPLTAWDHFWKPLLCVLCELCCHPEREVRTNAVTQLQRALCLPALTTMTHGQWESCFKEVLFPMLKALLSPVLDKVDPVGVEESRLRTAGLLCKVVLQQLQVLLKIPSFSTIWVRILEILGSYISANNSDYLRESVPEALKNMLLVMTTSGVLSNPNSSMLTDSNASVHEGVSSAQGEEFWRLTWMSIGQYLPDLKNELFPEDNEQTSEKTLLNTLIETSDNGLPPPSHTIPQPQHSAVEDITTSPVAVDPLPNFVHMNESVSDKPQMIYQDSSYQAYEQYQYQQQLQQGVANLQSPQQPWVEEQGHVPTSSSMLGEYAGSSQTYQP